MSKPVHASFLSPHFRQFNQTVWAMLIGVFLVRTTYCMSWPFLIIVLNQKLGASPAMVGILLGVSAGISSLLGLYVGYLSDKFGRKPLMLIGCLVMAVSFSALNFAHSFWQFFIVMALMGIGSPTLETSTKAVISDSFSDIKLREFALNIRYFLINVAGAIGVLTGLWVGFNNPLILFGGTAFTYLCYFFWIFILINPVKIISENKPTNLFSAIKIIKDDNVFLWLILANFLMLVVYSQFNASLPQIMTIHLKNEAAKFIVLLGVVNCATVVIFQFPLLKLLAKFNTSRRSQIGLILMLISQIAFIFIDKYSMLAWGVVFFVLSIGEAILFPTINVHIDELARPELRGSYFGAGNLSQLGGAAGPVVGGFILGAASDAVYFVFTSVLCACCIGIYQYLAHAETP